MVTGSGLPLEIYVLFYHQLRHPEDIPVAVIDLH